MLIFSNRPYFLGGLICAAWQSGYARSINWFLHIMMRGTDMMLAYALGRMDARFPAMEIGHSKYEPNHQWLPDGWVDQYR